MKTKLKNIMLWLFYSVFLVSIFLFAYFKLPSLLNLSNESEEIKIIKNIYTKLEKDIPVLDELRAYSKQVSISYINDENKAFKDILDYFDSDFTIDTIYKEHEDDDFQFCLNRYTVFNDERIYTEKCHDVNTIEYFNKKNMFTVKTSEPAKIVYVFTTMYKENDTVVYTDYEVTLTNTDGTWKISDGVIILSDDYAEYFVYIDKKEQ